MDYNAKDLQDFEQFESSNYLAHYGIPRRSGRYPWGSGENPYQSEKDFIGHYKELHDDGYNDEEIAKRMKMSKAQVVTQKTFYDAEKLFKKGLGEAEVAKKLGMSTTQLRAYISIANADRRGLEVAKVHALRDKGWSLRAIAKEMGYDNDSSIRSLMDEDAKAHQEASRKTADFLKKQIEEKRMIDIGVGTENELGVSKEKLAQAIEILKIEEGYQVFGGGIKQMTNRNQQTNQKVLCAPDVQAKEIYDFSNVKTINDYTHHKSTDSYDPKFVFPESLDSKRIEVRWPDQGGTERDGLVEIKPGTADLDMGNSNYCQVRIMVDYDEKNQTAYYIKGMAVYGDPKDFPPGKDIIVNTGKSREKKVLGDVLKACKTIKTSDGKEIIDQNNPFGALIKEGIDKPDQDTPKNGGQTYYFDEKGKKKLSLINKKTDEGDWDRWADKLPSQFLAKQPIKLINQQLELSKADSNEEFEEIRSLTNPTLKKQFLNDFAETMDKKAVHLYASSLPGQKYKVILPLEGLKETEAYCPTYENGTKLALIRYPHGGIFEIPIVTVNNNNAKGKKIIGAQASDAIAISWSAAKQLSGADYDGDTVMAIPLNDRVRIQSRKPFEELQNFDADSLYPEKPHAKTLKKGSPELEREMGAVSNLIMDMTLQGASDEELVQAVKHSMVVIDTPKHKLDYKQSEKDNNIRALKEKYQGRFNEDTGNLNTGAATLISMAKSPVNIEERKEGQWVSPTGERREYESERQPGDKRMYVDPETGEKLYSKTGRTYSKWEYYDPDTGKLVKEPNFIRDPETGKKKYQTEEGKPYIVKEKQGNIATTEVDKLTLYKDAFDLVRGSEAEKAYAEYANYIRDLANKARLEALNTGNLEYSPAANKVYREQYIELKKALEVSESNIPKEREAQRIANYDFELIENDNPGMTNAEKKKARQRCLSAARDKVGAKRSSIEITNKQWEAIQAGAISNNMLERILRYADKDILRQKAMPKEIRELTPARKQKITAMRNNGYTLKEIAQQVGFSTSTISAYLREGK